MNAALNKSLLLFWITITLVACGGGSSGGSGAIELTVVERGPGYLFVRWTDSGLALGASGYYDITLDGQRPGSVWGPSGVPLKYGTYLVGLDSSRRYCIVVKSFSNGNYLQDTSNEECESPLPDNSPPDPPVDFQVTGSTASTISFNWGSQGGLNNSDIVGFNLYRDGTKIRDAAKFDHRLLTDTNYCYRVTAYDHFNNESPPTDEVCGRTTQDLESPTSPINASATYSTSGGNTQIDLQWSPAQDDGEIDFYRVYRDGIYIGDVSDSTFTDIVTGTGSEFCYTLIAVDLTGKESMESSPACGSSVWKRDKIVNSRISISPIITIDPTDRIRAVYKTLSFDGASGNFLYNLYYVFLQSGLRIQPVNVSTSEYQTINNHSRVSATADTNGTIHLLHLAKPQFLPSAVYYETNAPGYWRKTAIEDSGSFSFEGSIAADSKAAAHACYEKNDNLRYATNQSGSWVTSTLLDTSSVPSGSVNFCRIAVDSRDFLHLIYSLSPTNELVYLTNSSGAWNSQVIDSNATVTFEAAITTSGLGEAMVAYLDTNNQELRFATNKSGTWVSEKVEDSASGARPSIGLDSNDKAHISFINGSPRLLRYATNRYGSWQRFNIDYPVSSGGTSLVIDSNDKVYIGYGYDDLSFWLASDG